MNISPQALQQFNEATIDKVIWKTIILTSLNKLYGLIGESSHFDILQNQNKSAIIRLQQPDKEKFVNSIMAHTFQMNKYSQNIESDVNCGIRINKCDNFLGLVMDQELIEE